MHFSYHNSTDYHKANNTSSNHNHEDNDASYNSTHDAYSDYSQTDNIN